jgi:hypothetical protein
VSGHVRKDYAASPDLGTLADLDTAQKFGAGTDQDSGAHDGVTIPRYLACSPESDFMEDRNVVFDDRSLSSDEACPVVEENPASDPGCRMDIHAEDFRSNALKVKSKIPPVAAPELVGHTVSANGCETFVKKERLASRLASGITIHDGGEVGGSALDQSRVDTKKIGQEWRQLRTIHVLAGKFAG